MLKKEQLLSLPLKELQAMAKDFGIKSPYKYNKQELVDLIMPAGLLHE